MIFARKLRISFYPEQFFFIAATDIVAVNINFDRSIYRSSKMNFLGLACRRLVSKSQVLSTRNMSQIAKLKMAGLSI